ncbi:hypothetical protein HK104_011183 [Borealophlyctis nickersoniae]|nr:hypothetical protein HK104_011183 [Borealophlyctis nickersoniae]
MGKWVEKSYDEEVLRKVKRLFTKTLEKVDKEIPEGAFGFEDFVDMWDENDLFIRRLFEFLVKETYYKKRGRTRHSETAPSRVQLASWAFDLMGDESDQPIETGSSSSSFSSSSHRRHLPLFTDLLASRSALVTSGIRRSRAPPTRTRVPLREGRFEMERTGEEAAGGSGSPPLLSTLISGGAGSRPAGAHGSGEEPLGTMARPRRRTRGSALDGVYIVDSLSSSTFNAESAVDLAVTATAGPPRERSASPEWP